ncbi:MULTISPECIES: bacillithiol system redox-active protein YtxJ [Geomicrobium]|uniref:Bacillithiol system protein YtxJ n=1 Tax=Geomicrobium sediminis TaxID=1347788 RepID=A0ABS2P8X8_9BACL|nr:MULTISPECIES: bacillithiol system redox-active protein YtxJ [Geomicrobium]MBM7631867.1 bacillithiol system protein YtxJ [Geomicrobium sediminis]GAJ99425.1 general stress protein [Geomicrobium sp. JCM 19055]
MQQVTTEQEIEQAFVQHEKVFVFKNSTTCPISEAAFEELKAFDEANDTGIPVYYLHVQDSRSLSNWVADEWSIKHESPQALLLKEFDVVWSKSHYDIKKDSLLDAARA